MNGSENLLEYWKTLFLITVAEFIVGFLLGITLPYWPVRLRLFASLELRMKGGHSYFLSPWLGWYMNNDLWVSLACLTSGANHGHAQKTGCGG